MSLKKRSVSLYGHQTSLALEEEFWEIIDSHVAESGRSFASFIQEQDDARMAIEDKRNLASHLRVWTLKHIQENAHINSA